MMNKRLIKLAVFVSVLFVSCFIFKTTDAFATTDGTIINLPGFLLNDEEATSQQTASSLQALFFLAILTLVPSILLMMTSFTRFLIVLHFLRSALGTQQMPTNQILIALALFLTMFVHADLITRVNEEALQPYSQGNITQQQAIDIAMVPFREFMGEQVAQKDLDLFARLSNQQYLKNDIESVPNTVLIPAFMIGELTKGFQIGVIIFMPFIVIDMVVASVLMAMGMMMLPPAMISLPFKILLFILVDGWNLVIQKVFETFMR